MRTRYFFTCLLLTGILCASIGVFSSTAGAQKNSGKNSGKYSKNGECGSAKIISGDHCEIIKMEFSFAGCKEELLYRYRKSTYSRHSLKY